MSSGPQRVIAEQVVVDLGLVAQDDAHRREHERPCVHAHGERRDYHGRGGMMGGVVGEEMEQLFWFLGEGDGLEVGERGMLELGVKGLRGFSLSFDRLGRLGEGGLKADNLLLEELQPLVELVSFDVLLRPLQVLHLNQFPT